MWPLSETSELGVLDNPFEHLVKKFDYPDVLINRSWVIFLSIHHYMVMRFYHRFMILWSTKGKKD